MTMMPSSYSRSKLTQKEREKAATPRGLTRYLGVNEINLWLSGRDQGTYTVSIARNDMWVAHHDCKDLAEAEAMYLNDAVVLL